MRGMARFGKEMTWGRFDKILHDCMKLLKNTFQNKRINKVKFLMTTLMKLLADRDFYLKYTKKTNDPQRKDVYVTKMTM